jgi:hypothetical protein
MRSILAIDPSTTRLGWATLELPLQPAALYSLAAGWKFGSWTMKGDTLVQKMRSIFPLLKGGADRAFAHLVIEMPTFFSTEKGRIAAREGYTINLGMTVGYIIGNLQGIPVTLYTPGEWKGMVSKEITRKKFYRTFEDADNADAYGNPMTYDHDTVDAIMLLHHWLSQKHEK